MIYAHYRDVPAADWPCRYFKPVEIACRGTGEILVDMDALAALDRFREAIGGPVRLSSAYRSAYHNARVGGAPLSQHRKGRAFDVVLGDRDKEAIRAAAAAVGFRGFGMRYKTFVHIDTGRARTW